MNQRDCIFPLSFILYSYIATYVYMYITLAKEFHTTKIYRDRDRETLTTSLVVREEIALFVEVMRGIQVRVFRMDVMKVLAIEDDTAQSSAGG